MMKTFGEKTTLNEEVIEALEEDKRVKYVYSHTIITLTVISLCVAIITLIIQNVIRVFGSESWFQFTMMGLIFASVILLGVMAGCVIRSLQFPRLSTGKRYVEPWMFVCIFFMGIFAFSPMAMLVRLDSVNFQTRLFDMGIVKSYLISIVIGVILLVYGWIKTWKDPLYSKDSGMSVMDYELMRQNQREAGLDPDKMPVILDSGRVKNMSVLDWHTLGMDLHLAGYDVFRDGFCGSKES